MEYTWLLLALEQLILVCRLRKTQLSSAYGRRDLARLSQRTQLMRMSNGVDGIRSRHEVCDGMNFQQASRSSFQQEQIWAIQIELDLGWCQAQHCDTTIDRRSLMASEITKAEETTLANILASD